MTECAICGEPAAGLKYCSQRCRSKSKNQKHYKRPTRSCPGCAMDLTGRHGQTKYCSNACRRWVANGHHELRVSAPHCKRCGAPMAGKMMTAAYCTKACKLAASEGRRRRDDHARYIKERERRIAYAIEYAKQNPHVGQAAKRKRKALMASAGMFRVSTRDWSRLVQRYGGRCFYCEVEAPMTMDHVVPISRGGTHSIGNLLPACAKCNSSKRHRTVMEWRMNRRVAVT